MQTFQGILFVLVACAALGFTFGNLECYHCDQSNKACLDPVNVSAIAKENCSSVLYPNPTCLKASANDSKIISRACYNKTLNGKAICDYFTDQQKQYGYVNIKCSTCDSNLCNSATTITVPILVSLSAIFINMYF